MDHEEAVRQKATERYLLGELDPDLRDQFEEHLFDCQDCAVDVRSATMFVEHAKVALAEAPASASARLSVAKPKTEPRTVWFSWFRPAFAIPVLALLLIVIGYQKFIAIPHLIEAANQPRVGPWASLNVSTRGSEATVIKVHAGEGFSLVMNLAPESGVVSYSVDLYNPAGKLEWSGSIPAPSGDQGRQIYVPGNHRQSGTYTLVMHAIAAAGERKDIGRYPVDLEILN